MTVNKNRVVYVVDGSKTQFLKFRGKTGPFSASDLSVSAGRPLLARQPFNSQDLDEVILGCIMPGPNEVNIARIVVLRLRCDNKVPTWTVQQNYASEIQAIDCAAKNISFGSSNLVLAGGQLGAILLGSFDDKRK